MSFNCYPQWCRLQMICLLITLALIVFQPLGSAIANDQLPVVHVACENQTPPVDGTQATGTKPVPAAAALEAATKEVRETFKQQFTNAKKDSDKLALAQKLQVLAKDSDDDLAVKFVCLEEARKLVAETGDLNQAFQSIDELALEFRVDPPQVKSATLKAAAPKLKTPEHNRDLVDKSILLVDQFESNDQYFDALSVATVAAQAVLKVKDKALAVSVQGVRRDSEEVAKEFSSAAKARDVLKSRPDDKEAKLIWGKWLCLRKDDWDEGLKFLRGVSDEKLKDLATRDLNRPDDKAGFLSLGTDWLDYAKSRKDRGHNRFAARSLYWLFKASEDATGIAKSKIETQIEQAELILNRSSPLAGLISAVSKKVLLKQHTELPEKGPNPDAYQELPPEGAVLVGINCKVGKYGQYTVITALQPIYATKLGRKFGAWRGRTDGQIVEILARDGYAVSDIGLGVGAYIDSIQVRFARVTRSGLNLADSYESKRFGGAREIGQYARGKTASDQPVVGIFGGAGDYLGSVGVVLTKP